MAAVQASATPSAAVNASSGDTTAAAGVAGSSTTNTQLLAGTAGGGNGSLTVANVHSSTVTDTSSANAQSGLSVALAPTVGAATPVPTGVTTAHSGTTSAIGVLAQNNVSTTSAGSVQVGGANQAPVSAVSSSSVDIKDTAASAAASGAAWAVAPGAAGSPSGVATPAVGNAAQTNSAAASSTGAIVQNTTTGSAVATVTVPGGPNNATPLTITDNRTVTGNYGAGATAASAPVAAIGAGAAGNAQAASGSSSAVGLTAQNTVNTNAAVSVHVSGQNFAPIQVIIDSITRIFNLGVASSTSGDATAGSGGTAGSASQAPASGSAQATGAQVQRNVDLRSSAAVKVQGDNYSPINILLNLAANLANWGVGLASSGDVQSGGASGTATSGAVSASGLQVMNLVSMWANASVDIEGNNYAPIYVKISFVTNIDNRGIAAASSGTVAAGHTPANASTGSDVSGGSHSGASRTSGLVGSSTKALGGDATAISNSVNADVLSAQLSSANGSKPITAVSIAQMLRSLPSGGWDPFLQQNMPTDTPAPVDGGLKSQSGNSLGAGLQSNVEQSNTQLVACRDPQVPCVAANLADLSIVSEDGSVNAAARDGTGRAGAGGVFAGSGGALANATPTPTAAPKTVSAPTGSSDHRRSLSITQTTLATADLVATGHVVLVDLWDQWPGRRLPPMPNAKDQKPSTTRVNADLSGWPGADELPLPDLATSTGASGAQVSQPRVPRALSRMPSRDAAASPDEEFPVMQLVVVNPWPMSKAAEELPMPLQTVPAVDRSPIATDTTAPDEPEDAGAAPVDFGLAVMLSLLGPLVGLRRGRLLLLVRQLIGSIRSIGTFKPNWSPGWRRQGERMLAIVRLTLGVLRLW